MKVLDPDFAKGDWYTWEVPGYHPVFTGLLVLLRAQACPVFLCHVATLLLLAFGIRRLAAALGNEGASVLALAGVVLLTGEGLSATRLMTFEFVPNNLGYALAVWGSAFLMEERWAGAGLLWGLAGAVHLSLGPIGGAVLAAFALLRRLSPRDLARLLACWLLPVLPVAVPALMHFEVLSPSSGQLEAHLVRAPWHLDPLHAPVGVLALQSGLLALGVFLWRRRRGPGAVLFGALSCVLLLAAAGWWLRSPFLIRLNLWRVSPLLVLLAYLALGLSLPWKGRGVLGAALLLALAGWLRNPDPLDRSRLPPEQEALFAWARERTRAGSRFLIPPDLQAFRVRSRRAVVWDFKAFPQEDAASAEWLRRMRDVVGAYQDPSRIPGRMARYGAGYVVMPAREPPLPMAEVFRNPAFRVYALDPRAPPGLE